MAMHREQHAMVFGETFGSFTAKCGDHSVIRHDALLSLKCVLGLFTHIFCGLHGSVVEIFTTCSYTKSNRVSQMDCPHQSFYFQHSNGELA